MAIPPPVGREELLSRLTPPAWGLLTVYPDEQLIVDSWCSVTGVVLRIRGRFIDLAGTPTSLDFRHAPNSNRTNLQTIHPLEQGFLRGMTVAIQSGTPQRGQCYVMVSLGRGRTLLGHVVQRLLADYVSLTYSPSWPTGKMVNSLDGRGAIRTITGTDPAAGVEVSETVPANATWRLISFLVSLVTDATAANRQPILLLDDGTTVFCRSGARVNVTASQTAPLSWFAGAAGAAVVGQDQTLPLPSNLYLPPSYRIRTTTAALQAADNYGAPVYLVEEFLEEVTTIPIFGV